MAKPVDLPYEQLESLLRAAATKTQCYELIANAPFGFPLEMAYLFLGFITLMIVNEPHQRLELVGYSDTEYYRMAVGNISFDPKSYHILLDDPINNFSKAVRILKPQSSHDWTNIQRHDSNKEVTKFNQANSGINHFSVYPLTGMQRGALMYNFYDFDQDEALKQAQLNFMETYTHLVSKAIDLKG